MTTVNDILIISLDSLAELVPNYVCKKYYKLSAFSREFDEKYK